MITQKKVLIIFFMIFVGILSCFSCLPVHADPATDQNNQQTQKTVTDENGDQRAATEKEEADLNKVYLKLQYYTGLKGHRVELLDESGNTIQDGRIDAMGVINFNDLDPGKYTLVLHKKSPKTTVVKKETTYSLQTIVEACLVVGIIGVLVTWRISKSKIESKYEYLREFQHELDLDGPYPVDTPMHDPSKSDEDEKNHETD